MDKLNIKVDLSNVGKLVKENDEFIFLYTSENIKDFISLIMPVRQKPLLKNIFQSFKKLMILGF